MSIKMTAKILLLALIVTVSCVPVKAEKSLGWEELSTIYKCPTWYAEAKLGIWTHWGPQAHPAYGGGWYARHMYMQDVGHEKWGKDAYKHQLKQFGHPSEAGYKEVLNDWKAENLDTDALLKYFKENLGARYFVAMANHHDHFDCWDSSYHPWNSVDVGPKRDLVGEFAASSRKVGMPFGVSSHDDRYLSWWNPAFGADKDGPMKGVPYDGHLTKADGIGKWWEGLDPADLYGMPPQKRTKEWVTAMKENWVKRHTELVDKYSPDLLWFDGHNFPYGSYGRQVSEHFYNQSLRKNGKIDVVLAGKPYGLPESSKKGWVMDYERGVPSEPPSRVFQSITTPRTWFYKLDYENDPTRKAKHNARSLAEMFADVLSKGGNMLLNMELTGDGRVPPDLKHMYDEFGAWVLLNGDAIYASKAWRATGDNRPSDRIAAKRDISEADLKQAAKHNDQYNERTLKSPAYPHDEVRYTYRGDKLYIFVLNPDVGDITLPSLGTASPHKPGKIKRIRLIGGNAATFKQTKAALTLSVPEKRPNKLVAVFEVSGVITQ